MQCQAGCLLQIRRIVKQYPLSNRDRQRSVRDQVVVKLSEAEARAFRIAVAAEELHDLPFADHVADLLRWIGGRARSFTGRRFAIESAALHEMPDGSIERPDAGVQIHVDADSRGAIAREPQDLR